MRRCSLSIGSNIAEGFDLRGPRQFRRHLVIAKGSAAELRSHLYLCLDRHYLEPPTVQRLQADSLEISQMLRALLNHLDRVLSRPHVSQPH